MKWQDQLGRIVWVKNPLQFIYLRETHYSSCGSQFPLKRKFLGDMAFVVGYELYAHPSRCNFHYRFWWLKTYDRDVSPNDVYNDNCPVEAVVPSSIAVGKKSMPYYPLMFEERGQ